MKNFFKLILYSFFITAFFACKQSDRKNVSFKDFVEELNNSHVSQRQERVKKYLLEIGTTPIIENKEHAHIVWFGVADTVKVQGDLQEGWSTSDVLTRIDCGEKAFFYISYSLPSDALLEYQLIIDGEKSMDLTNPLMAYNFEYDDRNVLQMPEFVSSSALIYRGEVRKGKTEPHIFKSNNPEFIDRKIEVYLPYGYSNEKKYPVLFVHDGTKKLYTTPFKNIVDNLIYDELMEPIIVVFVPHAERWKEYCLQDLDYAKVIAEDMAPYIKEKYSTANTADKWGTMGSSAGGNISMVIGLLYSNVFGNIGAQGGAGGIQICHVDEALKVYLKKRDKYPLKNIFGSVGNYDLEFPDRSIVLLDNARIFHGKLDSLSIEHVYKEFNMGHNDSNWNESIDDILIQFFGL